MSINLSCLQLVKPNVATYINHKGDIIIRNVSKLYLGLKCYLMLMLCYYENEICITEEKTKKI